MPTNQEDAGVFISTEKPAAGSDWISWTASLALHFIALLAVLSIPATVDETAHTQRTILTSLVYRSDTPVQPLRTPLRAPLSLKLTRPRVVPAAKPAQPVLVKQAPVFVPEAPRQRPAAIQAPEPVLQAAMPDAPIAEVRLKAPDLPSRPAAPPPPVKTGVFGSPGETLTGHAPAPTLEVHTGGFGGSDGNHSQAPAAGKAVHTGAFGDSVGPTPTGNNRPAAVTAAGFGNAAAPGPAPRRAEAAAVETPVEVLWKPKPSYTDEARTKKLEGNVTLEVVFRATGEVHVVRVVRGLGCGLDESARTAAEQIRFRPGKKDGVPVDRTGLVQITFELS